MNCIVSQYEKFVDCIKDKGIVCFGIGKLFDRHLTVFKNIGLIDKVIGLADNNTLLHGNTLQFGKKFLSIMNLDELVKFTEKDSNFIILITSLYTNEITQEIKKHNKLNSIKIFNLNEIFTEINSFYSIYSNVFYDINEDIGNNGENVTIAVVTHNRAELTIKLLDSISNNFGSYRGKILIGDNASDKTELEKVHKRLEEGDFNWQIIEFKENHNLSKSRNMLNRAAETEWIMQLDNDIYFTTNPIMKIKSDVQKTGCLIYGLPYYDVQLDTVCNYGSNLGFTVNQMGEKELEYSHNMPFEETEQMWKPMLCTYASGGACLFSKKFFESVGGYDENLFGYEDIEFMYRANKLGYKIGNVGMLALVHDHRTIDSALGKKYEAVRMDAGKISFSWEYLRRIYGFNFC